MLKDKLGDEWRPKGWAKVRLQRGSDIPSFESGADAMLESICEEIEKEENPFETEMLAGHGGRYNGFQKAKQAILTLLRSKKVV